MRVSYEPSGYLGKIMAIKIHLADDPLDFVSREFQRFTDEMKRWSFYRFSRSVGWRPAVNVYDDHQRIYVCVELAGVPKERIHVERRENRIIIRGERAAPEPPEHETPVCVLRMEIDSGPFQRAIDLPPHADLDTIEARSADGFLWIIVNKRGD